MSASSPTVPSTDDAEVIATADPTVSWVGMMEAWTLLGALAGAVLGMVGHALQRGRGTIGTAAPTAG